MRYRALGRTGFRVSAIAFGCGPVSGWMGELSAEEQCALVREAVERGVNWFDTAAGYGEGRSEAALGAALARLGNPPGLHVATKVRFLPEHLDDIPAWTRRSVAASLERLHLPRVSLLQLHNAITARRGEEPTSLTPADVLGPGGVLEAFRDLQAEGRVGRLGLTGIGQPGPLRAVVASGAFDTLQTPYSLLNPSAGHPMPAGFAEADYGNIFADCAAQGMGVFAIRVLAGGALAGNPPSPHTLRTPFFPLALYQRDRRRAAALAALLDPGTSLPACAIRFALDDPRVSGAILGFRVAAELEAALAALEGPPLPEAIVAAARAGIPPGGAESSP